MNNLVPTQSAGGDEAETAAPGPTLHPLLFGDDGLRAGWSVLLYLLLAAGCWLLVITTAASLSLLPSPSKGQAFHPTPQTTAIQETLSLAIFLVPALLMSLIEQRPFSRYGFPLRRAVRDLLLGLFWGITNLALLIGGLYLVHGISFDGVALSGLPAVASGLEWLGAFVLVGLFEESLTRGYLQYTLARGVAGIVRAMDPDNRYAHAIGFWIAAFLLSFALFSAGHLANPGESILGIVAVGLAGLVLAFSLWRTGALWWAIGWHCSWDWAQSCLFGTPDSGSVARLHILNTHPVGDAALSGGTDGPEGSVLVLAALLFAALVIHFTLPRRHYPLTRDQAPPEPTREAV